MDKETLSNYGWIVICVMVLAVMIALATPFGSFVSEAVQSTTKGLFDVNKNALDAAGIEIMGQEFDTMLNGGSSGGNGGTGETPVIPGEPETPVEPTPCTHTNTKTEGSVTVTCTTDGHTGKTICTDCTEVISNGSVISATGHTEVTDNAVSATCTATGLTAGKHCSVCNAVITAQTVVPATGHTTDNGTCGNCGETVSQYQLSGTWMFNESVNYPSENILQDINFTIMQSNTECHCMEIGRGWNIVCRYVQPTQSGAMSTTVNYDGVWYLNNRAIDFGSTPQPVSKEFYDWFTANATQQ